MNRKLIFLSSLISIIYAVLIWVLFLNVDVASNMIGFIVAYLGGAANVLLCIHIINKFK